MESLSNLFRQLKELFLRLDTPRRWAVGLAGAVVLAGIAASIVWGQRDDYRILYGRMDPAEASKVVTALEEQRVPFRLEAEGTAIYVPADRVHRVRLQLAGKGLPKSDGTGFEIFDKPTFGLSDFIQRANYLRAIQGELARTISQIEGVSSARVMVVIPESRLVIDAQRKATASVFVSLRYPGALANQGINAIRFLVSNAIEGLNPKDVTVVDNHGNVLFDPAEEGAKGSGSASFLQQRKEFERYLTEKLRSMLESVLGPGQAVVRVAAELEQDAVTRSDEVFDPNRTVPRSMTLKEDTTDNLTQASGGVAGIAANASTNLPTSPSTNGIIGNRQTRRDLTEEYAVSRTLSNVVQQAGGIKRVSAGVFVNARMEGSGASRKAVPRGPEDLAKLKRAVEHALGAQLLQGSKGTEVVLEEIEFTEPAAQEADGPAKRLEQMGRWMPIVRPVLALLAAVVALVLFARRFRPYREYSLDGVPVGAVLSESSKTPVGPEPAQAEPPVAREPVQQPMTPEKPRQADVVTDFDLDADRPGRVTVEVLRDMVRQNPEKLSEAARAWLAGRAENRKE